MLNKYVFLQFIFFMLSVFLINQCYVNKVGSFLLGFVCAACFIIYGKLCVLECRDRIISENVCRE